MNAKLLRAAALSALLLASCSETTAGGDDFPNSVQTVGELAVARMTAATSRLFPDALLPDLDTLLAGPGEGDARPAPDSGESGSGMTVDYSDTASGRVTVRSGGTEILALWDDDARSGNYNVLRRATTRRIPGGEISETVRAADSSAFEGPSAVCSGALLVRELVRSADGETFSARSLHAVAGCDAAAMARGNEVSRATSLRRGEGPADSVVYEDGDGDGLLLGSSGALVSATGLRFERAGDGAVATVRDTVLFRSFDDVRENHVVAYGAGISGADGNCSRRLVFSGEGEPSPGDSVALEDSLATSDGFAGRGEVRFALPAQGQPALVVRSAMELRGDGGEFAFEAVPERPYPMGGSQNDGSFVIRAKGDEPYEIDLDVSEDGLRGSFRPGDRGGERPISWDRDGRPRDF